MLPDAQLSALCVLSEMSAQSTTTGATGSGAGSKVARKPCVGSVLISVNGVRTQGLSFDNVVSLT